ncbi:hypothetical protein TI39_contig469g00002 [Zymoseptoria brevis]|uniref:Uncharacterized protein n=1 Tax=Zymoseptoria brevis TaxID=1047168 RepID=A0A0F4GJU4_9PEZI|nr:hypothetical protein TI39_contig469g00002 [Zymoseptoria brevis]
MAGAPPKKDYLDKALEKLESMIGKKSGKNIDPNKYSKQNEKITDKIRQMVEKATGKKIPAKVSN